MQGQKIPLLIFLLFIICTSAVNAQIKIKGRVIDFKERPVQDASVVVADSTGNIIDYSYTNQSGKFSFELKPAKITSRVLKISADNLGLKKSSETLILEQKKKTYEVIFHLKPETEQIEEVVLKPSQKISGNGNVTTLKTDPFLDNSEQTLEDVLQKLPGVEVLEDGTIKAHNKFIRKLMIEGDDMLGDNYQLLSKNLDAKVVDAVQIIDHFQDNPVLAEVLNSDQVALNVQLKDEFKNIWFGNAEIGLGNKDRRHASADVGLLRKKVKFLYFGDYNNLGNKAANQISGNPTSIDITSAYREKEIEPTLSSVFSIDKNEIGILKNEQSIFNEAFINSLGLVTNINPNLSLRARGSFSRDDQNQLFFSRSIFQVDNDPITYTENSRTNHINTIGSGEIELKYTGGEKSYLKNVLKYNNQPEDYDNQIIFNQKTVDQTLDKTEFSFYNHFNYSQTLGKNNVLHNYLYFGQNDISQDAHIQSFALNDFFDLRENSVIEQRANGSLTTYGVSTNLFSDFGDFSNQLEVGYESKKENRNTAIYNQVMDQKERIDSFQNNLDFKQQKLKLKTRLSYSFSEKAGLSLGLSFENITLETDFKSKRQWVFNPDINLDLRKLNIGRFNLAYKKTYAPPQSAFLFQNRQLSSYNVFIQGTENINLIRKEVYKFYYRWANNLKSQEIGLRLKYDDFEGNYSTINVIEENLRTASYQFRRGANILSGSLHYTNYFEDQNFTTNFGTSQSFNTQPVLVNSENFQDLKVYSSSYLVSGTTYFSMPLNFKFKANLNFSESDYNGVVSKTSWYNLTLGLHYNFSDEWFLKAHNDYYNTSQRSYYFLNSTLSYQPKNSDLSYRLVCNNLTNENNFSIRRIDEFTTFESNTKLLPRYILGSVKYRF